jgi:hypothetical protein
VENRPPGGAYLSEMPWKVAELVKAHGCMDIAIKLANNLRRKNTYDGVHLYVGSVVNVKQRQFYNLSALRHASHSKPRQ